jgi:thiamine pyrophosphate-dependent acetolactate synthase large subunit-like protein
MTSECIGCHEALRILSSHRTDEIVVTTMTPGREWVEFSRVPDLDLQLTGAMGKASSLGLGIAIGRPDRRVWVFDGDGSLLMNLGSLVTIANAAPRNVVLFVFENGVYEVSGSQPVPGEGKLSFAAMALGAGFAHAFDAQTADELEDAINGAMNSQGPTLVCIHVGQVGRPTASPPKTTAEAAHIIQGILAAS